MSGRRLNAARSSARRARSRALLSTVPRERRLGSSVERWRGTILLGLGVRKRVVRVGPLSETGRAPYDRSVDETARPILEVGAVLLLAAAAAGWLARRLTPARRHRLPGGRAARLAVHARLRRRARPAHPVRRRRRRPPAVRGRHRGRPRSAARETRARCSGRRRSRRWSRSADRRARRSSSAGLEPAAAALLGLSIALSSSVVIVNITRSRRRTTDPHTERVLVGWGVLQDVTGVAIAIVLLAILGSGRPLLESVARVWSASASSRSRPPRGSCRSRLVRLRPEHDLFLLVSVSTGLAVAGAGAVLAGIPIALAAFIAGLADQRQRRRGRGPPPAAARSATCSRSSSSSRSGRSSIRHALGRGLPWLGLALVLVVVAKSAARLLPGPVDAGSSDSPVQVAVGLGQIGEFSFVLASVALARGAIGQDVFAAMLAAVAVDDRRVDDPGPGSSADRPIRPAQPLADSRRVSRSGSSRSGS